MSDVVDLNLRRMAKVLESSVEATPYEVVSLIGCCNCRSTTFQLAHDKRVICAECKNLIDGCFWWTPNEPRPAA